MRFLNSIYWITINFVPALFFKIRRPHKKRLTIFLYHDIGDKSSKFAERYNLNVSNKVFEKQINFINKNFNIIHPNDILENKKLPDYPALITFDDGFLGAFENGIHHLSIKNIPSLMFLNMNCILNGRPVLSSIACYLSDFNHDFEQFAQRVGLSKPYHLTFTPQYLDLFIKEFGEIDLSQVIEYQGVLADESLIKNYHDPNVVVYGNHLYEHWNSEALTEEEFIENYKKNNEALNGLANQINMFAFPNGQPYICFNQKHIELLRLMRADKVYYSSGGINEEPGAFLLNRIALTEYENSQKKFWRKALSSLYTGNKPFGKVEKPSNTLLQ